MMLVKLSGNPTNVIPTSIKMLLPYNVTGFITTSPDMVVVRVDHNEPVRLLR